MRIGKLEISELVYTSITVAVVAADISETVLFQSFRSWVYTKNQLLGKMISCSWCFAHWLALVACLVLWVNPLWTFVIVGMSALPLLIINVLFYVMEKL